MDQDDIRIEKLNESFLRIYADRGILKELSDEFTFYVPGYMFQPAFKNKMWDGKIRLFDLRTNTIYCGLLKHIEKFASKKHYSINIDSDLNNDQDFPLILAQKFVNMLNISSNGKKIIPREDQINAFVTAIRTKRKLLISPTASGKSLIIYLILQQLIYRNKDVKGLIIVPRTSLVEQLYSDFADYASNISFDIEKRIQKSTTESVKQKNKNIIISTYQSLQKLSKEYFEDFDFIIGDEAHLFTAGSLKYIMESCINASYRIGLTGSLDGSKTHQLVLEGLFGEKTQVITTKELMDDGHLSKLEIKCFVLKHKPEISKEIVTNKDYQFEIDKIITSEERNRFIKNLALSLKNNTMILFERVDKHGKVLYDIINNSSNLGDKKVFFVYGKTDTDSREEIRKLLDKHNNIIVIASYGTFSTGINTRNLHNLIFASPSKSRIRNIQSIGRSLRTFDGKEKAVLFDIADDFRIGNGRYVNTTLNHFLERLNIYKSEKHEYKIYKIGI